MSQLFRFSILLRTLQSIPRLPSITMAAPSIFSRCPRALARLGFQKSPWVSAARNQRRKVTSFPLKPPQNERSWRPVVAWSVTGILSYASLHYISGTVPVSLDAPSIATLDDRTKRETSITSSSPMRLRMEKLIKDHQKKIVEELSRIDGKSFIVDEWNRPDGGGGISCVLQDGNVFEKAGVNVSVVYGQLPRPAIEKMRADHKSFVGTDVDSLDFFAAGLSLVLHPKNPMAPTVHLNYRYFETSDPKDPLHGPKNWWFGGGTDLTPSYIFPEDCKHFHQTIKDTCDKHDPSYYPKFKKWCDDYFYIPHRHEARGIGGIFFDDLDTEFLRHSTAHSSTNAQETLFSFVSDALASFLPAYVPIIERRKDMPFTQAEKDWQQQRRGRYVEFNLVYDRGTSFGLRTPSARVESILMSLPRTAEWVYMDPISGTKMGEEKKVPGEEVGGDEKKRERELINVLKYPREWA